MLRAGGSALDATQASNTSMEDSGVFNAGLGACLTSAGEVEMDAAVMEAEQRRFGAVAGIAGVANPIVVARAVMERTPHAVLQGAGAEAFARQLQLRFREGFPTEGQRLQWRQRRQALADGNAADAVAALGGVLGSDPRPAEPIGRNDTVGAAALDRRGRLAAGVTTGGTWMKLPGRVGDCPLPGAGLWADERGVAVCTGVGESSLRRLLAREVVDHLDHGAMEGCRAGMAVLKALFGDGQAGVIAIDPGGRPGFALNTRGMGRAVWTEGMGEPAVAVWPDEPWDRVVP